MSQISSFEESQLARIRAFKSALLATTTKSSNPPKQVDSSYLNHVNARINQIYHNLPLIASKLPSVSLSRRVIQHNALTLFPSRSTAQDSERRSFMGLSGAAVDRMGDISPDLVITLTSHDTLRLEGTLTSSSRFEFPLSSQISRTLIDNVNQHHLSKELFETICKSGGKETDDHKYRMIEGQFVMGLVDLREGAIDTSSGSPTKPRVHKVLLRPDQDLLVEHYMASKLTHLTKKSRQLQEHNIDDRLLVESLLVKELHPILALEPEAFTILNCFQSHGISSESVLTRPPVHYSSTTQLSHTRSFFTAIKNYRSTQKLALNEPFMGVDTRRAWAKAKGQLASIQIIKSTSLILPDVQRYKIWRTIRYEEQVNPEVTNYYSINFLIIEETPSTTTTTTDTKTTTSSIVDSSMPSTKYHFEVLFRMSPVRMDTAQDGYQHRFSLPSPSAVESYIQQLRWTFTAEGNGRRKCVTDISNPSALSNLVIRTSRDESDEVNKVLGNKNGSGQGRGGSLEGGNASKRNIPVPQSEPKKASSTTSTTTMSNTSSDTTALFNSDKNNNAMATGNDSKKRTLSKNNHGRKRHATTSTEATQQKSLYYNSFDDTLNGSTSGRKRTHK